MITRCLALNNTTGILASGATITNSAASFNVIGMEVDDSTVLNNVVIGNTGIAIGILTTNSTVGSNTIVVNGQDIDIISGTTQGNNTCSTGAC